MKKFAQGLRELGPYATVAILVPGGMVLAPLMWIAQRRRKAAHAATTAARGALSAR